MSELDKLRAQMAAAILGGFVKDVEDLEKAARWSLVVADTIIKEVQKRGAV